MAIVNFPFDHLHMKGAGEFATAARQAGYDLPVSEDLSALKKPCTVNGRRLENSMAVQPLEGLDGREDGSPSELTLARYEKLAAQGAGILWVEATAVCPEGRDSLRQLWLHQGSAAGFRELVRTIDGTAAKAGHRPPYKVLQLTHSGRCSVDAAGKPAPLAAFASPYLDPLMGRARIVTDDELDKLQEQVAEAARLACEAGFDAVDLKLCHQYLFKELLCAYTRPGRYGGSRENRFRFALGAVDQIRRRVGSQLDIAVRLNAYDGIPWPYGWGMAPHPDGAPKNVLQTGGDLLAANGGAPIAPHGEAPAATYSGALAGERTSNWSGNQNYRQIPVEGTSNWSGNPDYRQIPAGGASNWSGNPNYRQAPAGGTSNWSGNPDYRQAPAGGTSNWSGNPAPFQVSEGEKSSWQGNLGREQVKGTATSNWPGNPDFVPEACRSCRASRDACAACPVLKEAAVASNWPGNPDFVPEACRSCRASTDACATCETVQATAAAFAIPPMPGPMQTDLTEVKELIQQLYRRGVRIFNLTTNSPRFAPAGNGYLDNFSTTAKVDPFAGETALLQATKEIREAMPSDVMLVGTGISWFGPFSANVAAGGIDQRWFDIAGFGRSVMADNDFIPLILQGKTPDPARACVGCDSCFQLFFAGLPTGCPMQHRAYEELFRRLHNSGGNVIY